MSLKRRKRRSKKGREGEKKGGSLPRGFRGSELKAVEKKDGVSTEAHSGGQDGEKEILRPGTQPLLDELSCVKGVLGHGSLHAWIRSTANQGSKGEIKRRFEGTPNLKVFQNQ